MLRPNRGAKRLRLGTVAVFGRAGVGFACGRTGR
ncbi:MAG: hypothetical protein JWQ00_414, partial [Noviherbaspirillum sp.]|nr:hypothetical protein [Noviherbaspirillum sp.]